MIQQLNLQPQGQTEASFDTFYWKRRDSVDSDLGPEQENDVEILMSQDSIKKKFPKNATISSQKSSVMNSSRRTQNISILKRLGFICSVLKFVTKVKRNVRLSRENHLSPGIITIINDKASDLEQFISSKIAQGSLNGLKERLQNMISVANNWILMPESSIKLLLDLLILCFTIINLLYIPFKLGFLIDGSGFTLEGLDIFCIFLPFLFYAAEIPITLNSAFYFQGHLHKEKGEIKKHYQQNNLYKDLFVVFVMPICMFQEYFLLIIWIFRVGRISQYLAKVEGATFIVQIHSINWELSKLVGSLIFVNHIVACSWRLMARLEQNLGVTDNWVNKQGIQGSTWETQYIYSFYWSTITSTTIGYGDVVPVNRYEMLFVILMVPIMLVLFGYALGSIQSLFAQMKSREDKFIHKMGVVNNYIRKHMLSQQLSMKIRNYFDCYLRSNDNEDEANALVNQLHDDIKYEVNQQVYLPILQTSNFMRSHISPEVQNIICQHVKYQRYLPGEKIYQSGDVVKGLIFVMTGKLQLYIPNSDGDTIQHLRYVEKGQTVAEIDFILQLPAKYNVRAIDYSEVIIFKYKRLLRTLRKFPEEFEKFSVVKDCLRFNPYYKQVTKICDICQNTHLFVECPYTFYQGNKNFLIKEYSRTQQRRKYMRYQGRKRQSSRANFGLNLDMAIYASLDNNIIEEDILSEQFFGRVGFPSDKPTQTAQTAIEPKQSETRMIGGFMNLQNDDMELDSALKEARERGSSFKSVKYPVKLPTKSQNFKKTFTKLKSNMQEPYEVYHEHQGQLNHEITVNAQDNHSKHLHHHHHHQQSEQLNNHDNKHLPKLNAKNLIPVHESSTTSHIRQLDVILQDYIEALKHDKTEIVGFEKSHEYKHYYPQKNMANVFSKKPKIHRERNSLIRSRIALALPTLRTRKIY